jgi:hypothetical protein
MSDKVIPNFIRIDLNPHAEGEKAHQFIDYHSIVNENGSVKKGVAFGDGRVSIIFDYGEIGKLIATLEYIKMQIGDPDLKTVPKDAKRSIVK